MDDLRPDIGAYGNNVIQTPNIDRLAARGALFERSFVSEAVCAPSRASMMTSLRPDTTRLYYLDQTVDQMAPGATTMPDAFRAAGYDTVTIGKVYHNPADDANGFSLRMASAPQEYGDANWAQLSTRRWADRSGMQDVKNVGSAVTQLQKLTKGKAPWLFFVGINKPHMPFSAPAADWDRYNPDTIPLPVNPEGQSGIYPWTFLFRTDPWSYNDIAPLPAPTLPSSVARNLRWGYYASVSYTDSLVGQLLDALDASGAANNTIIVLWGDHGWKLGDHGVWAKASNADLDIRSPLIMAAPNRIVPGTRIPGIVEAVDIFPTLATMAGVSLPGNAEGQSFTPLFTTPTRTWKEAAFSQYPRLGTEADPSKTIMGYTVRTTSFRYTNWINSTGASVGRELFDLRTDPNETRNVANTPAYVSIVQQLETIRLNGWRAVRTNNSG